MVTKPTVLRARIATELRIKFPRGMTASQINQFMASQLSAAETREVLEGLERDGLVFRALEPREHPRGPLEVYVASALLRGKAKAGKGAAPCE